MERLTEKRDGQNVIPLRQDGKTKWSLCSAGMGGASTQFLYGEHADKLAEYEDLEEQGKLPKLPCAVGDTLYVNNVMQGWRFRCFKKEDRPYEVKVIFIGLSGADNCMHVVFSNGCIFQFWFSDIGKTIFLTKEEAESALKELEGKEDREIPWRKSHRPPLPGNAGRKKENVIRQN